MAKAGYCQLSVWFSMAKFVLVKPLALNPGVNPHILQPVNEAGLPAPLMVDS